jgi:hypothetical protein
MMSDQQPARTGQERLFSLSRFEKSVKVRKGDDEDLKATGRK